MNIKHIAPFMMLPLLTACGSKTAAEAENESEAATGTTTLQTGLNPADLDTTALPGTDFYQFACGGWMEANPLKPEYSRYGSFDRLAENNKEQLRTLIEGVAAQDNAEGSVAAKIADVFNSAMDSTTLNADGINPICDDLMRIEKAADKQELFVIFSELQAEGVGGLFGFYIDADIKQSSRNLLQIHQGGLLMGEREYYLDNDAATTAIRNAYKKYMQGRFERCEICDSAAAPARVQAVINMETRLARASRSAAERRDPERNYNLMTFDTLCLQFPGIDWKTYFTTMGAEDVREVSVRQPEPIHEVEKLWAELPLQTLKDYVSWQLINAAASYLDDEMRAATFEFYGRAMSGREEDRPRWKRAVDATEAVLGEAVGQLYVEKYFPAAAKERMVQLVKNLQVALGQRIDAQEWMSDETKAVAHDKLNAFIVKVGYPDKWKDYSTLETGKSYWENIKNASKWQLCDEIERKLNKPVDNTEWYMTPQTVNAYYNPTTNEICFPAGILQPPFFDMTADDAFNYGAIGVVIGHEMTHGFDDEGSKFDKDGNLHQWWSTEDRSAFEERTHVMRDFFNNIEVLPGLKANGQLTLGENLADHGGLQVAYQAFKNATAENPLSEADGFTPEQRFFLAYAGVWAGNIRDEEIRKRTKSDPHALGRWRVNGALPHIDAWYEAFGITEADPMFVPKDKRVTIW